MLQSSFGTALARRYPPLAAIALAVLLAIYALPSALNLPQSNPGQVAEYAPVSGNPGTAPPGGNFAGLGLGEGGAAEGAGGGPGGTAGASTILVPNTFDCVGSPPRQTADPLSPPCVPSFGGENGGATWQGVSGRQVTVMFHFDGAAGFCTHAGGAAANSCDPPGGYYDLNDPAEANQYFLFHYLNDWMRYFNAHYQAYGRLVHFYAYMDDVGATGSYTQDDAAADAAKNWSDYHPFAALDETGQYGDTYAAAMAQHKTLNFGGQGSLRPESYYLGYPGYFWSFPPPIERVASEWATWVCTRIWNQPVSFDGDGKTGQSRKLGLLTTDDPTTPDTQEQQKLSLQYLQRDCGITQSDFAATGTFHYNHGDTSGPQSGWGVQNMTTFSQRGVTTILMPGGDEYEDERAASELRYHPEWVLEGDGLNDGTLAAIAEPADEYDHAVVVTHQTLQNADGEPVEPACLSALLEVDPTIDRTSLDIDYACAFFYDDIRQLFTGIQLAGPHLTPGAMDQGFHAIPPKPSSGPTEPSCFYLASDYTCVKDAVVEWWDSTAQPESTANAGAGSAGNGCWRMWQGGARYLPGDWPDGDAVDLRRPNDVCNLYGGGYNPNIVSR